jgi:hypothetical protein
MPSDYDVLVARDSTLPLLVATVWRRRRLVRINFRYAERLRRIRKLLTMFLQHNVRKRLVTIFLQHKTASCVVVAWYELIFVLMPSDDDVLVTQNSMGSPVWLHGPALCTADSPDARSVASLFVSPRRIGVRQFALLSVPGLKS